MSLGEANGTVLPTPESLDAAHGYPSLNTLAELFLANGSRQIFKVMALLML